jgi:hypothetical protein
MFWSRDLSSFTSQNPAPSRHQARLIIGQAMFWCVGTFQDSRPIPRSLVRRTGAPAGGYGLPVSEPAGASGYWSAGEPT